MQPEGTEGPGGPGSRRDSASWAGGLVVAAIAALGVALRLYRFNRESLWLDEVFSYDHARMPLGDILLGRNGVNVPPFYLLLLKCWTLVSAADWWMRLLSIALGSLSLVLAWRFAQRLFGRGPAARVYLLLFAVSGVLIYYSREVRMYALLVPLTLLANIAYLRATGDGARRRDWIALGALMAAILYTHSVAGLHVASLCVLLALYVLSDKSERPARLKSSLWCFGTLGVGFVPVVLPLLHHPGGVAWIASMLRGENLGGVAYRILAELLLRPSLAISGNLYWSLSGVMVLLAVWGILPDWSARRRGGAGCHVSCERRQETRQPFDSGPGQPRPEGRGNGRSLLKQADQEDGRGCGPSFAATSGPNRSTVPAPDAYMPRMDRAAFVPVTILLPFTVLILVSFAKPLLIDRYLICVVPSLLAAVTMGWAKLRPAAIRYGVLACLIAAAMTGDVSRARHKEGLDWREACVRVRGLCGPNDTIAFHAGYYVSPFRYYAPDLAPRLHAFPGEGDKDFGRVESIVKEMAARSDTLWVFYAYPGTTDPRFVIPRMLDATYGAKSIHRFEGTDIYLVEYDLKRKLK